MACGRLAEGDAVDPRMSRLLARGEWRAAAAGAAGAATGARPAGRVSNEWAAENVRWGLRVL